MKTFIQQFYLKKDGDGDEDNIEIGGTVDMPSY